ncbi:hypothetical protein BDK51DRAFT_27085 [Blyttiomyces helicus]|uniref:F-box domain-containing protein n=1 Tax=Blyttiomyces helicus TaxID=388810 RepID=A0A4P9WKM2_9FUNG|nr:hypothetical protein BDK51DRAFT_27085 [Blyttiomyces helicus]|eukprot:RKO93549.1 hypothetical protein BDK51DRAFT_27085 [Blyttiomyces helicus]
MNLDTVDLEAVASTIARLEFLRTPRMRFADEDEPGPSVGPRIRSWAPGHCLSAAEMPAPTAEVPKPSLPYLEVIEFPPSCEPTPNASDKFLETLVSLRPPLRRVILGGSHLQSEAHLAALLPACRTIEDLDLTECTPITYATLAALETHPPLHRLNLRLKTQITLPAMVPFLSARGSQLRFLFFHWPNIGHDIFPAIASYARNIEHLALSGSDGDDDTDSRGRASSSYRTFVMPARG